MLRSLDEIENNICDCGIIFYFDEGKDGSKSTKLLQFSYCIIEGGDDGGINQKYEQLSAQFIAEYIGEIQKKNSSAEKLLFKSKVKSALQSLEKHFTVRDNVIINSNWSFVSEPLNAMVNPTEQELQLLEFMLSKDN
jgi:hypothetical protein